MELGLLANTFVSQKIGSLLFLLMPPGKTLAQVLIIISQAEENHPFLLNSVFLKSIFPNRKGGGGGGVVVEWKK